MTAVPTAAAATAATAVPVVIMFAVPAAASAEPESNADRGLRIGRITVVPRRVIARRVVVTVISVVAGRGRRRPVAIACGAPAPQLASLA